MDVMDFNKISRKIEDAREIIDDLRDIIDTDSDDKDEYKQILSQAVSVIEEDVDTLEGILELPF